jgi:hypothetical protein
MSYLAEIGVDSVDVYFEGSISYPANFSGHPDNWTPEEPPEIEIVQVEYETCGRAYIGGKWVKCDLLVADVTSIIPEEYLQKFQEMIESLSPQDLDKAA